jgi:CBS domain containing-hemolysin-like protein
LLPIQSKEDKQMVLLFAFALFAISFSFLCSILEAVLLSITPSYVERLNKENPSLGETLRAYRDDIDIPLSGILTLNTIAHTLGAMLVGVQAGNLFGEDSGVDLGLFYLNAETIIGILMTLAILIASEIIPKTIGANNWERLTPFTIRTLKVIIWVCKPLIWITQLITKRLKKDKNVSVFNRADFNAMVEIGSKEGVFEENEFKIISNLMRFEKVLVRDIMTPRMVVKAAPEDMTIQEFYEKNDQLRFSRIPIYEERIDNVNGFFLKDQFLTKIINKEGHLPLKDIRRDILIVHENIAIPKAFQKLMTEREHIALVVDEFGGMEGIITMEDIIETLLGTEIVDEYDGVEDMQALARKNWEMRAKKLGILTIDEYNEQIETPEDLTGN